MIKIHIKSNYITITGHANYDDAGKDIVCASVSSIVISSINCALRFNKDSLEYKESTDKLEIRVLSSDESTKIVMDNMISMLRELEEEYPKNIKIMKEE